MWLFSHCNDSNWLRRSTMQNICHHVGMEHWTTGPQRLSPFAMTRFDNISCCHRARHRKAYRTWARAFSGLVGTAIFCWRNTGWRKAGWNFVKLCFWNCKTLSRHNYSRPEELWYFFPKKLHVVNLAKQSSIKKILPASPPFIPWQFSNPWACGEGCSNSREP